MNKVVLGVLALAAVGLAVTRLQTRPPAGCPACSLPPAAAPAPSPPPAVDVIDLELELELAPAKAEPFVPFDAPVPVPDLLPGVGDFLAGVFP
jgi:hypothetical protein